jgi:hypothetical protein
MEEGEVEIDVAKEKYIEKSSEIIRYRSNLY